MNIKEELVDVKNTVASGEMSVESLQRSISKMLLSTDLPNVERVAKKFDNDLELVIYTVSPSNQTKAALKVIDEVMIYLEEEASG